MSATKRRSSPVERLVDAAGLVAVFGVQYFATRLVPEVHGTAPLIAALGLLLLGGTLAAKLVELLGLPHLTGYLLTGIVAGPTCWRSSTRPPRVGSRP